MFACICACKHVCIYMYASTHVHVFVRVSVHLYACMSTHIFAKFPALVCLCVYTFNLLDVSVCMDATIWFIDDFVYWQVLQQYSCKCIFFWLWGHIIYLRETQTSPCSECRPSLTHVFPTCAKLERIPSWYLWWSSYVKEYNKLSYVIEIVFVHAWYVQTSWDNWFVEAWFPRMRSCKILYDLWLRLNCQVYFHTSVYVYSCKNKCVNESIVRIACGIL